jgi:membrane protease subunit (stomatin/prohibitin family)
MAELMNFSKNYTDHSTDTGFQFEFHCDRCQNGYRTRFQNSAVGMASTALNAASNLLGGFFSSASNLSENVKSASWQQAWDKAFIDASKEAMPHFTQCSRCQSWVCNEKCWNMKKGLCKGCAPDLGVEMAAAQSSKSVEEVWAHAAMAEEDKHLTTEDWREGIRATCPACEAPLEGNVKFCPNCGANVKAKENCAKCGAKLAKGAKFCPECGEKA